MNREKINEAAGEYSKKLGKCRDVTWNDGEYGFIAGADWLMQQPLSERLNDAEREKVLKLYNKAQKDNYDNSIEGAIKCTVSAVLMNCLADVFGADLFITNQPTAI